MRGVLVYSYWKICFQIFVLKYKDVVGVAKYAELGVRISGILVFFFS